MISPLGGPVISLLPPPPKFSKKIVTVIFKKVVVVRAHLQMGIKIPDQRINLKVEHENKIKR